jgi:hypothetical protein
MTPISYGRLALSLPLLRFSAFLRSAAMTLGCWIGAVALVLLTQVLTTKFENATILLLFAQFLLVAGIVGLRSFALNWSRVAYAWPDAPKQIPFWIRQKPSLNRFFPSLADPLGFLQRIAIAVPAILASIAATVGLSSIHPVLGLVGLYLTPILPFALIVSLGWPRTASEAVDEPPLPVRETRAIAKGTFQFRLVTYLWVCTPAWWIAASVLALPAEFPSTRPIMPYVFILTALPVLTLSAAWLCGVGGLLYARFRSSNTATVFD